MSVDASIIAAELQRGTGPHVPFDFLPLPVLLQRAAARFPDRTAVWDEHSALVYKELLGEVHRLAHHLIRSGCRPGNRVVSCVPRGVGAIVAQAAIFAAGAVYVPIDPAYPRAVLGRILDGSKPDYIIGPADVLAACLSARADAPAHVVGVPLDDPAVRAAIATCPTAPPDVELNGSDGAYIIHTSGSSGHPKGVLVSHGAIANSIRARSYHYPEPIRSLLMVSPLTFDGSMGGVWWTLADGGTLILSPSDPGRMLAAVRRAITGPDDVSHTVLTATLYRQALEGLDHARTHLRQIILGGERCPEALVQAHHALIPGVVLVNMYGPTEAAVWCTSTVLLPGEDVTIGRPSANVEILVLDPDGSPLPSGAPGELHISGIQLADGYVGDAALTAEKFIPHPWKPGQRLYRSGDRAHWRPDGRLALSGRMDDQVKIRGYRVDLAGVRAQLGSHPGVSDVVVAMRSRSGRAGARTPEVLTAYVVPSAGARSAASELRQAWTRIVEDVVTESPAGPGGDRGFDTRGWTSSYTRAALPDEDMVEWGEWTERLLRETAPSTVLDLGCGTGLPLLRVAPHCRRYVGMDVSRSTLDGLRRAVDRAGLAQVELSVGEATDAARFAGAGFDLVVLNSVTQYFPGSDYLTSTLDAALRAVRDGGRIVYGDVRDLSLARAFHASVVLAQADEEAPSAVLARRLQRRLEEDTELVVDPRWFVTALAKRPGTFVEVRPRRGRRRNEMNDFRFDAVVHTADAVRPIDVEPWRDWSEEGLDLGLVRTMLRSGARTLGLRRVPSARAAGAAAVAASLLSCPGRTARDLRALAAEAESRAPHPEDLYAVAAECGYRCHVSRIAAHEGGAFDVAFVRADVSGSAGPPVLPRFMGAEAVPAMSDLTTEPMRRQVVARARAELVPQLRRHADTVLPAHERPGSYVVLPELPVTRHGKVDLSALPEPTPVRPDLSTAYAVPVTPTERTVAALWSDLLAIDRVGADDNLIELGGDSLQAARCAVLLSEEFGVVVPHGALLAASTVRGVARLIDQAVANRPEAASRTSGSRTTPQADDGGALPLSPAQSVVGALDHSVHGFLNSETALSVHYRITGKLDVTALREAVDALIERHEALRVKVLLDASGGRQEVLAATPDQLIYRRIDASDPEHALREAAALPTALELDPAAGRVFSVRLTSASDTEHLLVLRLHHLVGDALSVNLVEEELVELYEAHLAGRPARLKPAPSYRDWVQTIHQKFVASSDWLEVEPYRSAVEYWTGRSAGVAPIRLPGEFKPRGHRPTELRSVLLSASEVAALLDTARKNQATLFTALLAGLTHVLSADLAETDVRLLAVHASRDNPGEDRLIGFLLNLLLLRMDVPPGRTFASALQATAAVTQDALTHGQIPIGSLAHQIPPLMTVLGESQLILVESLPAVQDVSLTGCTVRRSNLLDKEFLGPRFQFPVDLLVLARPEGDTVRLVALYGPDSIEGQYIERMLNRLRRVLSDGGADPSLPADKLAERDPWPGRRAEGAVSALQ